ncbi:MAG TPA: alpha/beta fold hydrolase, partial [Solirubrobacteraceae bacterium]
MPAQLDFQRVGAGEPLLLLHGIGSHWPMWSPVLERLAPERDVVALSLPGFGASPELDGGEPPSVPALARAVAAFARETLGIERAHVAGNSLGGGIALQLARTGFALSACGLSPIGFWNR